ncbi:MAG TPA: hypothetical protein VH854_04915 [Thermoanaerobaculia bacterium]|jgi:hypothetical protein|nr:hypothetical protein [Thermoanaerobaculia bacterium]
MVIRFGVWSVVVAAALASAAAALGAETAPDGRARAVIRGSGKDVSIVYRAPLNPAPSAATSRAADPIAEALRRKKSGADDASVVDYLRQSQAELPDVVDAGAIRQLRRAGAGDSVVAALATLAAVDIGPTSDDAGPPAPSEGESAAYAGAYPDLAGMGYPFYGGGVYGGGFFGGRRFGPRVMHHGSHAFPGHDGFHLKAPFFGMKRPFVGNARPMPAHVARMSGPVHGGGAPRRTR